MKKIVFGAVFIFMISCSSALQAQQYIYNYNIAFIEEGRTLLYPLAGGLNNPQFSAIDVNQDGKSDIYMFDRAGNKSLVLLNEGETGEINYRYWQQYQHIFPEMFDWAILIDYNCDGLEDIITGYDNGIRTYLASYDGYQINFTTDIDKLQFKEAGFYFDLAVGVIDIPGFADIDFDGDIDILSFNIAGGIVDHYINKQVEEGLPCGTMQLEHINSCWGNFYESGLTYSVELDYDCKGITSGTNNAHAGSTFMIFDEDADNDMDIVLGDLAFNKLNKLVNGGDNTFAHIVAQDTTFPEYDNPYDDPIFPAAFFIDVNNDGKKDMLVSPNNINQSENFKNVWYYKNISGNDSVVFDYQLDSLFVSEMVDLGEGAYPVYFDYNYDGLLDIVVGNNGYFQSGDYKGMLALFENTGTATQAQFTLITRDWGGLSAFDFNLLVPTFGDLDGDGDLDMLVGEEEGYLHYFKNIGPPDGPASFVLQAAQYQGLDLGKNAAPQLIDLNGDGLDDLILGEKNGNLNYLENTGTAAAPFFTVVNEFWGNVDVRAPLAITGSSIPFMYKNADGNYELYVGSENGTIYFYQPTADFTGAFTEVTEKFNNIDEGNYSAISVADIDNDNLPDFITGNQRGGITIYRDENATGIVDNINSDDHVLVYPNPANQQIVLESLSGKEIAKAVVYGLDGRTYLTVNLSPQTKQILNINAIPQGIYFIYLVDKYNNSIATVNFIKN